MPLAAPLVLALTLAIVCARADTYRSGNAALDILLHSSRGIRALDAEVAGCLYEGRWFVDGAPVAARDACLRCACARGALACARRACAPPPARPPARCHLRQRRGACCPELHCPDGVTVLERGASARQELDELAAVARPASARHACVSDGGVFAAGSALATRAACEQCFCLGGARRCVRPRCLPPPPGCRARPAPGACCPTRYYCDPPADATAGADSTPHTTHSPLPTRTYDCAVGGQLVPEGERVPAAAAGAQSDNCSACFCLRGAVACAAAACAPPLHGCAPLLRAGQCCPHQYRCDHSHRESAPHHYNPISNNALVATRHDDRSLHSTKPHKHEASTSAVPTSTLTTRHVPAVPSTKQQPVSTNKVKRKTNDPPPTTAAAGATSRDDDVTQATAAATQKPTTPAAEPASSTTVTEEPMENTTEQPEGSMKIMINGTINCTAEISSASLPLNTSVTDDDAEKVHLEAQPRVPYIGDRAVEAHTSNPNDIITDRNVNGGFDENETFTINVTSSLRTNTTHTTHTTHSTSAPSLTTISKDDHVPPDLNDAQNISKKAKEDYDYDYTEPTLPPSLPNLKIIPFVAADAVVDDDAPPKETLTYPILEREDKFPVYYPSVESKEMPFANRREDVYNPTQYPVFVNGKAEAAPYPTLTHGGVGLPGADHPAAAAVPTSPHEYTVTAALGHRAPQLHKVSRKPPSTSSTFQLKTPAVNLFSPPVETEGGFLPKGPGVAGEYYAVYPNTPVPPSLPHLTTSMQLDTGMDSEKDVAGGCVGGAGRRVPEGASASLKCSVCTCARGSLRCSARACAAPPPSCTRRPPDSRAPDPCCGDIVCEQDIKTTPAPTLATRGVEITVNEAVVPVEIKSEILLFDPPPDRSVPVVINEVTENNLQDNSIQIDTKVDVGSQNQTTVSTVPANNKTEETTTNIAVLTKPTEQPLTTTVTTTTAEAQEHADSNDTRNQSQEDEEEEEDEGFSFGSVLKLLLSDSYDSTTGSPYKKKPTTPTTTKTFPTTTSTPAPKTTTRRIVMKPTVAPFVPMPHHPYAPPKRVFTPNTVNRIDHLVLGEATAIQKTTPRPVSATFRPVSTSLKPAPTRATTPTPTTTTMRRSQVATREEPTSAAPPGALGGGVGALRVSGCNIYGRMYRVGRIIAELSSPCRECRCTELGVQCQDRAC